MKLADKLGTRVSLKVMRKVDFGFYLGEGTEEVLLPKKEVTGELTAGDIVDVFLYKDSMDRLIATTAEPYIRIGKPAVLKVKETGKIGAFLDWGLAKDLLLPFREQTAKVREGREYLTALYVDKSGRLCATMKVYELLDTDSSYKKDDRVEGIVYDTSQNFGIFVAVDDRFSALIPKREAYGNLEVGNRVKARVVEVRPDGKLTLSVREKVEVQMKDDAKRLEKEIRERGGRLDFNDKADPEIIKEEFGLSKSAFKRAVGALLKEGIIQITDKSIEIIQK